MKHTKNAKVNKKSELREKRKFKFGRPPATKSLKESIEKKHNFKHLKRYRKKKKKRLNKIKRYRKNKLYKIKRKSYTKSWQLSRHEGKKMQKCARRKK